MTDIDVQSLTSMISSISMLYSADDPRIPAQASIDLGEKLHAPIIEVPGAGHSLEKEYAPIATVLNETLMANLPKNSKETHGKHL